MEENGGKETMVELKNGIPRHTQYDYYQNGIDSSIGAQEANEIIEEIIQIMRKHRVTVKTSQQLLQDTIYAIEKETVIT